jgi:peptidyl-prolyl cis-trans isomerase D
MAILEKLRTKAGLLLAIVIGMSLLAFVLSDLLDSGGTLFNRSKFEIAEVSGKSIPYDDYMARVTELEDVQKLQTGQLSLTETELDQVREAAWNNMIQDLLLEKQYEKIGVQVSDEELTDLITGTNPHPYITQLFSDPSTGIFNREAFNLFMQRLESTDEMTDEKKYYLFVENQIVRETKYRKYLSLLDQGLYATAKEAEHLRAFQEKMVDANYISGNFSTISDSAVTVTRQDIKDYYKSHLNKYEQKESRDIHLTYFEVVPSQDDYKYAEEQINEILPDFNSAENIKLFVNQESDVSFDDRNYSDGEIVPDSLNDFMFSAKAGDTYGPYFYENSYRISKLAEINYLPDSVRARHILLQVTSQNQGTIMQLADSLINMIKNGVSFEVIAMTNSIDNSAQVGGDLGWFREGTMVQPLSDSVFYGKKGEIMKVVTDYGVHIVEIVDQSKPVKKIKVGTVIKNVEPSDATDQKYYTLANEFAGVNNTNEQFLSAVNDTSFSGSVQVVPDLAPMDKSLPGIQNGRQLVIWSYQAETGDVSNVFKLDNKYVVATVDKIREKGYAPMEDILTELENQVRKEKKAELLSSKMKEAASGKTSLEEIASSLGFQVQSVTGINFSSDIFGNSGVEPAPVGAALTLKADTVSDPVVGDNGVYLISVNNVGEIALGEAGQTKQSIETDYSSLANYYSYDALEKIEGVVDNRREFF